jgi:hypothetical protein
VLYWALSYIAIYHIELTQCDVSAARLAQCKRCSTGLQEGKQYAGRFLGLEGLFAQVPLDRPRDCMRARARVQVEQSMFEWGTVWTLWLRRSEG